MVEDGSLVVPSKIFKQLCTTHNWSNLSFHRMKFSRVNFFEIAWQKLEDEEELDMA
jgi:hypothetical protein